MWGDGSGPDVLVGGTPGREHPPHSKGLKTGETGLISVSVADKTDNKPYRSFAALHFALVRTNLVEQSARKTTLV
jgi:hypothetical protein